MDEKQLTVEVNFKGSPEPVHGKCNARLTHGMPPGVVRYCAGTPMAGRARCIGHGGAIPRGVDHPRFKGKGYSRALPTDMQARVLEAMQDPDLCRLLLDVAVTDDRIAQVFERAQEGESRDAWAAVQSAAMTMKATVDTPAESLPGRDDRIKAIAQDLWNLAFAARQAHGHEDEVERLQEHKRKLVKEEAQIQARLAVGASLQQLTALMVTVQTLVRELVSDPDVRMLLLTKLRERFDFGGNHQQDERRQLMAAARGEDVTSDDDV